MPSLLDLLSSQTPNLQTRKVLILLGLQNDFCLPDGKLPVSTESGFLDRIKELVPEFREFGEVIWVRSEWKEERTVNDPNETGCTVVVGELEEESKKETSRSKERQESAQDHPIDALFEGTRTATRQREVGAKDETVTSEDISSAPANKRAKTTAAATETIPAPGPIEAEDDSSDADSDVIARENNDDELFLSLKPRRGPCCLPGTIGAEYFAAIKPLIDESVDRQLVKSFYSAFSGTNLLTTMRSRLVTELYICGCITNLSVYATAMDAARYGIRITLVDDCLGYRKRDRHDKAIKQLVDVMGAEVYSSENLIDRLRYPPEETEEEPPESEDEEYTTVCTSTPFEYRKEGVGIFPLRNRSSQAGTTSVFPSASEYAESSRAGPSDPDSLTSSVGGLRRAESDPNGGEAEIEHITEQPIAQPQRNDVNDLEESSLVQVGRRHESPAAGAALKRLSPVPGLHIASTDTDSDPRMVEGNQNDVQTSEHRLAPGSMQYQNMVQQNTTSTNVVTDIPLFGPDLEEESQGSRILSNFLPPELAGQIFQKLHDEVSWQKMYHAAGEVPRMVCCQGLIDMRGNMPVYRHPSDQTIALLPWSETVNVVRDEAEKLVEHPLNHVLIQIYRGGTDFISEHSDKTLDVVRGSKILNVSFGAERKMRLRTKRGAQPPSKPRTTYRIPMPHNSTLIMSLETNAKYLHGIMANKRPKLQLSEAELAYGGLRISLTFRHIGTFISGDSCYIWGQGATSKREDTAARTINGEPAESEMLIQAFGAENQATRFDWDAFYGDGFDVLHLK